jgi:Tfp pilus assembly major pilin PilA
MRILPSFFPFHIGRRFVGYAVHYSGTAWLELLICAAVIAILTATAGGIYREQIRVAAVLRAIAGIPMTDIKTEMMVYHAHTGQWPDSFEALQQWTVFPHHASRTDPAVQSTTIEAGAIHLVLNGAMKGGIVTIRPGVPDADPLGPVAWYAGRPMNRQGLSLAGKDKTTIPQALIHPRLR